MKCAFGIDADSFNREQNSKYLEIGEKMFAPSLLVGLKFLAIPILPRWVLDLIPVG